MCKVVVLTLMTTAKKKMADKAKPKAFPMESSTSEMNGEATAVSSMQKSEKTKAIINCRTVPGRMRTQKPTRNSLRSKRRRMSTRGSMTTGFKKSHHALLPRLDQLPPEEGLLKVEREEAKCSAERRRLLVEDGPPRLVKEDRVEQ